MSQRIVDTTWDDLFGAGLLVLIIYALPYILIGLVIICAFAYKWLLPSVSVILDGIGSFMLYAFWAFLCIIGCILAIAIILGIGYSIYKKKWKVFLYIGLSIGATILVSKLVLLYLTYRDSLILFNI